MTSNRMPKIDIDVISEKLNKRQIGLASELINAEGRLYSEIPSSKNVSVKYIWRHVVFMISGRPRHSGNPYMMKNENDYELDFNDDQTQWSMQFKYKKYKKVIDTVVDHILLRDWFPDKEWEQYRFDGTKNKEMRNGNYNIKRGKTPKGWIG